MGHLGKHRRVLSVAATLVLRLIGTPCAPTASVGSSPPAGSGDWPENSTLRAFPMLLS